MNNDKRKKNVVEYQGKYKVTEGKLPSGFWFVPDYSSKKAKPKISVTFT